jgi:competence protein ComEA
VRNLLEEHRRAAGGSVEVAPTAEPTTSRLGSPLGSPVGSPLESPQASTLGSPLSSPVASPRASLPTPHRERPSSGAWARFIHRLQARVPVRLDPGRRTALALGAAVVLAAVVTGFWVLSARPKALAVSSTVPPLPGAHSPHGTAAAPPGTSSAGTSSPAGASPSASASPAVVVVDVAGKVHRPGVYRLPTGARVDDAIRAAGGALGGVRLDSLNLAARLVDGQQVAVGVPPAVGGPVAGADPGGGAAGGGAAGGAGGAVPDAGTAATPVNLNTATLDQLETLPGVGPVLAQHIVDWRTAHGSFASVDQLDDVPGIGEVKFAALRSLVSA